MSKEIKENAGIIATVGVINPLAAITILTVGFIGGVFFKHRKKQKLTVEKIKQPLLNGLSTAPLTASKTVKEAVKKEQIRQVMSDLGKKSAAARLKKKKQRN